MEYNKILIVHPSIKDIEQLKQSLNKDVKMYITTSIKDISIYKYVTNIGFLYHREMNFPFYYDSYKEVIDQQSIETYYMSNVLKSHLVKHVVKNNITIDFLSCSLPKFAQKELLEWGHNHNVYLRFSLDNTGVLPANWIMENGTFMSSPVNISPIYFNSLIYKWKVILDTLHIFMNDPDGNLAKHFEVHHISKMIIQRSNVPSSDIFVDINNSFIHAYIQLPEGYILNGNGYCIDISEMKIYLSDNTTIPYNEWKGLIECCSDSTRPNRKNIIKNIGVKGLLETIQLQQNGGYLIRMNNNCFELYDSYSIGRVNIGGGGLVGAHAGNKQLEQDNTLDNIEENKIQNSIYIYSCYHKGIKESWSGGIVGSSSGIYTDIIIQSCYSLGDIYVYAGGILGGIEYIYDNSYTIIDNRMHIVRECYTSELQDGENLYIEGGGGIVGNININNYRIKVENSYTTGDISYVYIDTNYFGGGIYSYIDLENTDNFQNINTYTKDWNYNEILINASNIRFGQYNVELLQTNHSKILNNNDLLHYNLNDGFNEYDISGEYTNTTILYPRLKSFLNKYSDYRQYYVFKKIDTTIIQRGYTSWIYPVTDIQKAYKIHRSENLNEVNDTMEIIKESYTSHNDIPLYVNTDILHTGFYMDMMYQLYKDRDSSLNDISSNIYEYPDHKIRTKIESASNNYDISNNLPNFRNFVEKRYMMIRARNYLNHLKNNKEQIKVKEEVNQLMKQRTNVNRYDYKIMDVVLGDMTRIKDNEEIQDTDYYNKNSIENSDLNIRLEHQNKFSRDIPKSIYKTVNPQYSASGLFFLSDFIKNFNTFSRVNFADESIIGLSNENVVIDFSFNTINSSIKNANETNSETFSEELKKYAKGVSEYFPSYYGYRNIYDTSNLQVFTDQGFENTYINAFSDSGVEENKKFKNMGMQSLWSIFELLHMKKYKRLLQQNITRIIPPYKNTIDIRNQNVQLPPEQFTSLEQMKNINNENLNTIQRYLYNEFSNQYYPSHLFFDISK